MRKFRGKRFDWLRSKTGTAVIGIGVLAAGAGITAAAALSTPPPPPSSVEFVPKAPPPEPTRPTVNAYILGDSISSGAGVGVDHKRYGDVMARRMNWALETDAMGGTGFAAKGIRNQTDPTADDRFIMRLPELVEQDPDVVIVAGGRNDLYMPMPEVEAAATEFFTQLRAELPEAEIVIVSPWRWNTTADEKWIASETEMTAIFSEIAASVDATLVDANAELVDINDSNQAELLSSDNFHPDTEGYKLIGEELARTLVEKGLPRGPEIWDQTGVMTGEYVDSTDAFFNQD